MKCIEEVCDILDLLYQHGWDERNGGNLSYRLTKEEVRTICEEDEFIRFFKYDFNLEPLIGMYFLITGTGKYFKNCKKNPEENLGILQVIDAHTLGLLWGYTNNGSPTSEAPTHLKSHMERLKWDNEHRVILHTHPTNVICMTHIHDLDSKHWTEDLWKMQTESIVVFPEGIAVLPWMICGGEEIANHTSFLMKEYRSVVWAHHGIFCAGKNLDEVFGLVETIEKAAEIYLRIYDKKIYQSISKKDLLKVAKAFQLEYRKGIID